MSEFEAGRELDIVIAEKVMGWKRAKESFDWFMPGYDGSVSSLAMPYYSTVRSDAYLVTVKMGENEDTKYKFIEALCFLEGLPLTWDADYMQMYHLMIAAPCHICLAALEVIKNVLDP